MAILEEGSSISTRDKILRYLLKSRESKEDCCTVKNIADALDLSTNATRQYLVVLEKEGLVVRTEKKGITGRPAMLYSLHEDALEVFPKLYADFSITLIDELKKELGTNQTTKVLGNVGKSIADECQSIMDNNPKRFPPAKNLKEKLENIARLLGDYGKYPVLEEDENSYALKNYNCLVYGIVKADPIVCKVDETIISELVGKKTKKEECIRDGDACCLYRVDKE